MKLPKRFALSTLLLAMLIVAVVFGLLAWRTTSLKREVASINSERVAYLALSDSWLWPVLENEGSVRLKKGLNGTLYVAEESVTNKAAIAKLEETANRMRALGVKEIDVWFIEEEVHQGETIEVHRTITSDSIQRVVEHVTK